MPPVDGPASKTALPDVVPFPWLYVSPLSTVSWPVPVVATEPPVSSVKVEGDVLTVIVSAVAMFSGPALSHVPPEKDSDALTLTVPLLVRPPVMVRAPPAPLVGVMVPSFTRVEPIERVDALPQLLLVRTRFPVECDEVGVGTVDDAFFVARVTSSEQVPCTLSVS